MNSNLKVALVHDYLTQTGGAERVFELLCQYFPEADIFTAIYESEMTIDLGDRLVQTTVLQNIPQASKHFRLLAPLYFPAFRALDLQDYDLIISSSSSFAKAVRKRPGAVHICFCHNVTRFLWDTKTYLDAFSTYKKYYWLIDRIFSHLRKLDVAYAQEPDLYIANSTTVSERIQRIYQKPAITINYPIDPDRFTFSNLKGDFFLVASRLLGYKRVDIIVEAFNWLGLPLVIIGDGPERARLEDLALDNVQFLGNVSDVERAQLMANARGVIVAALEDYGLVPIEANASGTPVISFGKGGVLDTQVPGMTGLFFNHQVPDSIQAAIRQFERIEWNYEAIRNHVMQNFTQQVFFDRIARVLEESDLLKQSLIAQNNLL